MESIHYFYDTLETLLAFLKLWQKCLHINSRAVFITSHFLVGNKKLFDFMNI
jgi:hypothetical protein